MMYVVTAVVSLVAGFGFGLYASKKWPSKFDKAADDLAKELEKLQN